MTPILVSCILSTSVFFVDDDENDNFRGRRRDGGSLHEHPLLKVVSDRMALLAG